MSSKPLEGIRVLDFTRVLAGPYCTMLLADMGADVIKVERPKYGDDTRHFGPFKNDESGYFVYLNRGKKSITLDLKRPEAREIVLQLVEKSDVIVENFRPGVMEKLGFDYEEVKKVNPRIVYASISGFGQNSHYTKRPAYDLVAQAMGGLMSITGYAHTPPTRSGASLGDMSAALYTTFGIMVALFHRERNGEGQYIDVAMVDSIFSLLESNVMRYTVGNVIPERIGSRHPISSPFDVFKAKDDYLVIAVANEALFTKLCEAMGQPDLWKDQRFETDAKRTENEQALKELIETWLSRYTVDEAVDLLNEYGIPCSPILNIQSICEDEHIAQREMLVDIEQPGTGVFKVTGNPVKLSKTPARIKSHSPRLGEHTEQILTDLLNYSHDDIAQLKEKGLF